MAVSRYKVLIVEKDGAELDYNGELDLNSANIFLDTTVATGFVADEVQGALIELRKLAGNFSFKQVLADEVVEIRARQQMLVDGHVSVLGHMRVLGEIVDVSQRTKEQFFYKKIQLDQVVVVEQDRLLYYRQNLMVYGHLRVLGEVVEA